MITKLTGQYFYAVGRRKTATAQVRLYKGDGKIAIVNDQDAKHYFNPEYLVEQIYAPLKLVGMGNNFDISVLVKGGGMSSQADAIRHGVARALVVFDTELKSTLKKAGLLTRDAREKESKKYGLKKARKAPQYSKR